MHVTVAHVNTGERKLCVFFSAGATRYAVDALHVREVTRAGDSGPLPDLSLPSKDLSLLLGGEAEPEARASMTLDVTPPVSVRVRKVDGVFDTAGMPRWAIQGRLIPLIAPAIRGALEYEGRLVFELDADGASRGLPKQVRPLTRHTREVDQALIFLVQGERLGIPLHHVVQVLEADAHFNRSPNAGTFLGVAFHRSQLCPVFTVGPLGLVQPFVILFEVNGDLLGLSVSQVEGVRTGGAIDHAPVLDVARMFS